MQLISVGSSAGGAKAKAVIGFNRKTGEIVSGQFNLATGFEHWLLKINTGDKPYSNIEQAYYLMAAAPAAPAAPVDSLAEMIRFLISEKTCNLEGIGR